MKPMQTFFNFHLLLERDENSGRKQHSKEAEKAVSEKNCRNRYWKGSYQEKSPQHGRSFEGTMI